MTTATHAQIVGLLGEVDDLFVKRIADTGASLDEISEALGDAQNEDVLGEPPHIASSPRVTEVRAILEELMDTDEDDLEEGYRAL
jgi:division protein CdvB (Snf7/Vps24/ESCRT-III family)